MTETATSTPFESWAIVEVYGHQKYAGLISEQSIGGCNFVRLDVPATEHNAAFTKLLGQGAIFSITPVEESVARALAGSYDKRPVSVYELPAEQRRVAQMDEDGPDNNEEWYR